MPGRVGEVHAPAAVVAVDPARVPAVRVGLEGRAALDEPGEDAVEVVLGDEERVVLHGDLDVDGGEIEGDAVGGRHGQEHSGRCADLQTEDSGEEAGGLLPVAGENDGVVELD